MKININILHRYFENNCNHKEEEMIRQWLNEDPNNWSLFIKERKIFDSMLLLGNKKKIKPNLANRFRKTAYELLKIACIVIFTIGIFYIIQMQTEENINLQAISVPEGQRLNLILPDGTEVWLNACSTIEYPTKFGKKKRQVSINGEAFFKVAKNEKKPFIVETQNCFMEVLGTEFNVDAYSNNQHIEISLLEGSLLVKPYNDTESLILIPDQKVTVDKNGNCKVTPIYDYDPYKWRDGLICFQSESFESIMKTFENQFGMSISINNTSILNNEFTGKFRQTDGLEYALKILQKNVNFKYEINKNTQSVIIN